MSISPPPTKRARLDNKISMGDAGAGLISVYSWNVNGIDPLLQNTIADFFTRSTAHTSHPTTVSLPLRTFLQRHDWPTLCFLQEVKIRSQDDNKMNQVRRAVSNASASSQPDYEAHFCLPTRERYVLSGGKGGRHYGVCTLIRKDFADASVTTVRTVDWDVEGRILIVQTRAADATPKLAVINVYLVNGTGLPYRDHVNGNILGTRHDRKLQVHALLQRECRQLESEGFGVIIAGDINIARATIDGYPRLRQSPIQHVHNRQDFERRFMGVAALYDHAKDTEEPLGMIDTFRALHPEKRGYSYYSRAVSFGESCDRVDMVLASHSLSAACIEAGMHEQLADRSSSDHVPIYAVFRFRAAT